MKSRKYIIQICYRQSAVLGDIRHMVVSHDVSFSPSLLCFPYPSTFFFLLFCIIAINSLTYLRTASLAFVRMIPCVYIDIISFSASPAVPGYNGTDVTWRSPIGPQWGRNLIYRCTATPAVLTKIKAMFIYWCFPRVHSRIDKL